MQGSDSIGENGLVGGFMGLKVDIEGAKNTGGRERRRQQESTHHKKKNNKPIRYETGLDQTSN